jgi:hypothetical protein
VSADRIVGRPIGTVWGKSTGAAMMGACAPDVRPDERPMSTRKLILAALLCGVAILAASAIQILLAR